MNKFLIVGLGNIGIDYVMTRHNIGFEILDQISENYEVKFESRRFGDIIKIKKSGKSLIFLKPNTFMNLSGKAVKYWKNKERIHNDNLLVILDDLNLDFGISRLRKSGKDGGHNGLKSINEWLGSNKYCRLRFGIGNDFKKGSQTNYVLENWSDEESRSLSNHIDHNIDIIFHFINHGVENTMNKYN
jgi:PTH1 family peptidyl-tRNA hydrolase